MTLDLAALVEHADLGRLLLWMGHARLNNKNEGKCLLYQLSQKFIFPFSTLKLSKPSLLTFQIMHFTSLEHYRRRFCINEYGFIFFFFIYFD